MNKIIPQERRRSMTELGAKSGCIVGFIAGVLVTNYIIFPILTGYTLLQLLRLL